MSFKHLDRSMRRGPFWGPVVVACGLLLVAGLACDRGSEPAQVMEEAAEHAEQAKGLARQAADDARAAADAAVDEAVETAEEAEQELRAAADEIEDEVGDLDPGPARTGAPVGVD